MRRLYLVVYDEKMSRNDLTAYLGSLPNCAHWFYSMPNSIFVLWDDTAFALYDKIKEHFPNHGRMFVTEVPDGNSQGWIPGNHWDLIEKKGFSHTYRLEFDGYWRDGREDALPSCSGIYCVYGAVYNSPTNTVTLKRLLYIGQSENIHERHRNHESKPMWRKELNSEEGLFYSVAPLAREELLICEAALIVKHHPPCNLKSQEFFPYGETHVMTAGRNALLSPDFMVGGQSSK